MISHKYKCIFIHIPKCAGTTVELYFYKYAKAPLYHEVPGLPMMRREYLAPTINLYPDFFTFTFVRNPFDRFISYYFFGIDLALKLNRFPKYQTLHECIELTEELLTIDNFHKNTLVGPHQIRLGDYSYEWNHSRLQKEFLLDANPTHYFGVQRLNSAPCSFIGRQEYFDKDFNCLLDILGMPSFPIEKRNVSRKCTPTNQPRHYSSYYDKASQRMVENMYACDLERLGYEFEDKNAIRVLIPLYDEKIARTIKERTNITWWSMAKNKILLPRIRIQLLRIIKSYQLRIMRLILK